MTINDRDINFAIVLADNRGRQGIQRLVVNNIITKVRDFKESAGELNREASGASQNIGLSIGSLNVSGAEVVERALIKGIMFSLLRWPLDTEARKQITRAARQGLYSNNALQSKNIAEEEWEKLEKHLMEGLNGSYAE